MARIAVVTDSTADLSPELLREHGVTMVPLNVHIGDETYKDQIEITSREFMKRLPLARQLPTTSQPAPGQFEETFRTLAADRDAVLAVLISSKLSGTIQSAGIARDAVAATLDVEIVDSLNASMGLGLQVVRAARLAASGLGVQDIARRLRAETNAYHLVFFVDTLEYLQRGGRIGRAASLLGSLIQLKPLLRIDEGQIVPFERTRTKARAIEGLKSFVKSFPNIAELAILYSTEQQDAEELADSLTNAFKRDRIHIAQFSPVIGTHIGPGALGVCVYEGEAS
ncbi:MAG: DegV family protein [Thermomicrobiales bacterium]